MCVVPVLVLANQGSEEAHDMRHATQLVDGEMVPVQEDAENEGADVDDEEGVEGDDRKRGHNRVLDLDGAGKMTGSEANEQHGQ